MFAHRTTFLRKLFVATVAVVVLAGASSVASASYSSITVFGDSLSDGGNDFLYTGKSFPPAPYAQRFSNGPTAVEVLASHLALPLAPSLAGGSNYAYGGAETGLGNYLAVPRPGVPSIINTVFSGVLPYPATGTLAQVQSFKGSFAPQSLVVLWAGPNDLFTALALGQNPENSILPAMNNLVQAVTTLYFAGARSILMPNMPDIGATPFGLGSGDPAGLTAFSLAFNFFLNKTIDDLGLALSGLDLIKFDTFGLLTSVVADKDTFGLSNVSDACYNDVTGAVCANPDQYLFWDSAHPTARGHQILAAGFAVAVPEPATLALFILAMAGLAVLRRQQQ